MWWRVARLIAVDTRMVSEWFLASWVGVGETAGESRAVAMSEVVDGMSFPC
jgi:hypothetical protein